MLTSILSHFIRSASATAKSEEGGSILYLIPTRFLLSVSLVTSQVGWRGLIGLLFLWSFKNVHVTVLNFS